MDSKKKSIDPVPSIRIKIKHEKFTANIKLNGKRLKILKIFHVISGITEECSLPPFLLKIVVEVLAKPIRQQKERKATQRKRKK